MNAAVGTRYSYLIPPNIILNRDELPPPECGETIHVLFRYDEDDHFHVLNIKSKYISFQIFYFEQFRYDDSNMWGLCEVSDVNRFIINWYQRLVKKRIEYLF